MPSGHHNELWSFAAGLVDGAAGTGNGADHGGESLSNLAAMGLVTRDTRINSEGVRLVHFSHASQQKLPVPSLSGQSAQVQEPSCMP